MTEFLLLRGAELMVWLETHGAITAAIGAVLLAPGVMCCIAARRGAVVSRQSVARIEQRLTQMSSALELLTDTTESALRSAFAEIERLSAETPVAAEREALHTRVKTAARNGRTAREIAQSEGVSEGEVRLRLRLRGEEASPPLPN